MRVLIGYDWLTPALLLNILHQQGIEPNPGPSPYSTYQDTQVDDIVDLVSDCESIGSSTHIDSQESDSEDERLLTGFVDEVFQQSVEHVPYDNSSYNTSWTALVTANMQSLNSKWEAISAWKQNI